jgi:hypothetical protein
MRAKIRAQKVGSGYRMIAILPHTDEIEYPQEGLVHAKRSDVYRDADAMYGHDGAGVWAYNPRNHTIKID